MVANLCIYLIPASFYLLPPHLSSSINRMRFSSDYHEERRLWSIRRWNAGLMEMWWPRCKEEENVFMQIVLQLLLWTCFIIKFQPFSPAHTQAAVSVFFRFMSICLSTSYRFDVYIRLTGDFQLRPGVTKWFICLLLPFLPEQQNEINYNEQKIDKTKLHCDLSGRLCHVLSENVAMLILVVVTVSISGRQLERVERVVSVHVRLREAAQQRVHGARTQTRRTPLRRGGGGHRQLHGRPVHTEWVTVINKQPVAVCLHFHIHCRYSGSGSSIITHIITALITATLIRLHHYSPHLWHAARTHAYEWRSRKATPPWNQLWETQSKTVTFPSLQIENCFTMPKHRVSSPWCLSSPIVQFLLDLWVHSRMTCLIHPVGSYLCIRVYL